MGMTQKYPERLDKLSISVHNWVIDLDKEVVAMTVKDYRIALGWSISELARRAGMTQKTLRRVENGQPVYDYTVGAVAKALSEGLGRTITVKDLEGVNIISR